MIELTIGMPFVATFLIAVATTILGYLRKTPPENFDFGKFLATVCVGVLVGALTSALGWTYNQALEWLSASGLTVYLYWFASVIAKRLPSKTTA